MDREVKYQTQPITLNSGSTTGTIDTTEVTLDAQWEVCTGVALYPVSGALTLLVGLSTSTGYVLQDLTISTDYEVTAAVPPKDRYKPVNVEAGGRKITITTRPTATLTANQTYHMVFRLERHLAKKA